MRRACCAGRSAFGPMVSALLVLLQACAEPSPPVAGPAPAPAVAAAAPPPAAPAPAPPRARVVALGDLHADLPQALAALRLAGLVDEAGRWSGGSTTLVQTGDITDRGADSQELIRLMQRLTTEAAAAGGEVRALLGNHEVMNLAGDWRYVTPEDLAQFGGEAARRQALSAQGAEGAWLRGQPIVTVLDQVVYCHGGLTPEYAKMGLDRLNTLVPQVVDGGLPKEALGERSPIWYRGYVQDESPARCAELDQALAAAGATRMVVGHTTQREGRIATRCGGRLLVIDTGIAGHYGGHLAALELRAGDAWALYPGGAEDLADP